MRISRLALAGMAVVLSVTAFGLLAGCAPTDADQVPPTEAPQEDVAPTTEDPLSSQALVENRCSACHNLDRVQAAEYDRAGWERTVDRMIGNGLSLTDEEYAAIVEYLSTR